MISYKDRSFCINQHCSCPEERRYTPKVQREADRWWGRPNAPICLGDLCRETGKTK